MTEQEILEGNRLIAEFMGVKITGTKYGCNHPLVTCAYPNYSNLKYHSSWDWLIPVIDKIYSSDYYLDYCLSNLGQFNDDIHINTKFISSTFESVIEYLKWYNKNIKQ